MRGREEPLRSTVWGQLANTSEVLKRLSVEMYVGGLSPREVEDRLEKARGHFVLGKSTGRELSA